MKNLLFNLIDAKITSFKEDYLVNLKTTKAGMNYYFFESRQKKNTEFFIDNHIYELIGWHVSLYENLTDFENKTEVGYHITMNMLNEETKELFKFRAYFSKSNVQVCFTFKNSQDEKVNIAEKDIADAVVFAANQAYQFYNLFWEIYSRVREFQANEYDNLINELEQLSKELTINVFSARALQAWVSYDNSLEKVMDNLVKWSEFEINKTKNSYSHFARLKEQASKQILQIQEALTVETESRQNDNTIESHLNLPTPVSQQVNELKMIDDELHQLAKDKSVRTMSKLIREYSLQNKKFEIVKKDNVALACILRMRALEAEARRELMKILLSNSAYEATSQSELTELIELIPVIDMPEVFMCVKNNRVLALELLLQRHSYFNLNSPVKTTKKTILETAYELRFLEMFQLLLKYGAYCDMTNSKGQTLLMQACINDRTKEVEALLNAGASGYLRHANGFMPLGMATMDVKKLPNLEIVRLFVNKYGCTILNCMQGRLGQRATPLLYACQNGWFEAVKLYIELEALSIIKRETDNIAAPELCVAKNFPEIFEYIIKNALDNRFSNYSECLRIAKAFGYKHFEAIIKRSGNLDSSLKVDMFFVPDSIVTDMLIEKLSSNNQKANFFQPAQLKSSEKSVTDPRLDDKNNKSTIATRK